MFVLQVPDLFFLSFFIFFHYHMNMPKVSDPGKEYFLKVASRKWNFREAFTHYEHTLKLPSNTVCQIMESDLNLITKSRKAFAEPSNAILSDLQVRWHTYQHHNYIDSFIPFPFIVLIVLRKTDGKPATFSATATITATFSDTTTHRYRPY